jgi:hypothetical protein
VAIRSLGLVGTWARQFCGRDHGEIRDVAAGLDKLGFTWVFPAAGTMIFCPT